MGYITMSEFATAGGLCSQLQIYASLSAVAKANNLKIAFSQEMIDYKSRIWVFDLLKIKCELKPHSFFNDFIQYCAPTCWWKSNYSYYWKCLL